MKKLLILLSFAALTACNSEDDNTQTANSACYTGSLTVTSNTNPAAAPFELSGVRFEIKESEGGTFDLTMHDISFAQTMPMKLTIVIPALTYGDVAGDGRDRIYSLANPIVPYIGGKPYSAFQIVDFTGDYERSGVRLNISFTCRNPMIPVGDEPLDHKAVFTGTTN